MRRRCLMLGLLLLPAMGGCYERVVSSRGLGSMGANVQDGYRSNTAADRAWDSIFGHPQQDTPMKGADTMPLQGKSKWTQDVTGNRGEVR